MTDNSPRTPNVSIDIDEYQRARNELVTRLSALPVSRARALAMLDLSIAALTRLSIPVSRIREYVELLVSMHSHTAISMPTRDEIAKILKGQRDAD